MSDVVFLFSSWSKKMPPYLSPAVLWLDPTSAQAVHFFFVKMYDRISRKIQYINMYSRNDDLKSLTEPFPWIQARLNTEGILYVVIFFLCTAPWKCVEQQKKICNDCGMPSWLCVDDCSGLGRNWQLKWAHFNSVCIHVSVVI